MSLPTIPALQLPRIAYTHHKDHDPALTEPAKFRPVINDPAMPKPRAGGLWTSPVTSSFPVDGKWPILATAWSDWCRSENIFLEDCTHFLEIQPDPYAQILRIDSLADLRALELGYGIHPDKRFPRFSAVMDWERLVLDRVDAVYLTERGQDETRFPGDGGPSWYTWDVPTVLWLKPNYRVVAP